MFELPAGARYGLVVGLCFVLGAVLIPAISAMGVHYAVATVIAFAIVTVIGFALHCRWTYRVERSRDGFLRYASAMLLNLPLTVILIGLLHDAAGLPVAWSAPLASALLVGWNFVVVRWAVLRSPNGKAR